MYRSQQQPTGDPATMSGQILLRIGIALFAVAAPCAAVVSRRTLFVLLPVAALLIIIGGLLLPGTAAQLLRHLRTALTRPLIVIPLLLLVWAGLSFVWTPFPALATERYLRTTGTILIAAAALACLPARVKPAYSILLPLGVGLAALGAVAATLLLPPTPPLPEAEGAETLRRAVAGLVVLVWPAMAMLVLRGRGAIAGLLAVAVASATVLVWAPIALAALIIGFAVFSAAYAAPERMARARGAALAALMLGAPLLILALDALTGGHDHGGLLGTLHVWADIVKSEGLKLITGHGFDTSARALAAGLLPAGAPRGILFEIWYELGLVGAGGAAVLMWAAFTSAARFGQASGSFLMAGIAAVLTISIAGVSISQLWWTTQLAGVALAFAVALHTQTRAETSRAHAFTPRPVLKI